MIKKFFVWLFGLVGFVPAADLSEATHKFHVQSIELTQTQQRLAKLQQDLTAAEHAKETAEAEVIELRTQAFELQYDTMEALKSENIRVKEQVKETVIRCKEIEAQVTAIMQHDETYSFGGKPAIPGATALTVTNDTGLELPDCYRSVSVVGRTILDDAGTQRIHQAITFADKYGVALQYLKTQTSVLDRIMDYVLRSGGIQFTLGYNTECTEVELYYKMIVGVPTDALLLEKNLPE